MPWIVAAALARLRQPGFTRRNSDKWCVDVTRAAFTGCPWWFGRWSVQPQPGPLQHLQQQRDNTQPQDDTRYANSITAMSCTKPGRWHTCVHGRLVYVR
jgi:hypothetical protein